MEDGKILVLRGAIGQLNVAPKMVGGRLRRLGGLMGREKKGRVML